MNKHIIESIHIYPIKGLGGIELQSANTLQRGMQYDRRWMLVDMKGNFITQRTEPKMALFSCDIDSKLNVIFNKDKLSINLEECSRTQILVTVWDSQTYAYEVSSEASEWFSNKLNRACRLVKMSDDFDRYKKLSRGPNQTKVSFADGYPYLIIGTASLEKISNEVGFNIPKNRFRANIIISTNIPHVEDSWDKLEIGSTRMQVIKPCARCTVVNINQESGIPSKEPLKTLSQYRKVGNKVNFGVNVICLSEGRIKLGDSLNLV